MKHDLKMRKEKVFPMLFFLFCVFSTCGSPCIFTGRQKKEVSSVPLLHTRWEFICPSDDTNRIDSTRIPLYIVFDTAAQCRGFSGCNYFYGTYTASSKRIDIDYMGATKKLCMDTRMQQDEKTFQNIFKQGNINAYRILGKELVLMAKKREVARFRAVANQESKPEKS
jgi:heat shock protein HslJ